MTNFTSQQVKILKKLLADPPLANECELAEQFLLQYVLCEALIRLVGRHYRERNSQKKNQTRIYRWILV